MTSNNQNKLNIKVVDMDPAMQASAQKVTHPL